VGAKAATIVRGVRAVEKNPPEVKPGTIYGDGRTAERIARAIKAFLERRSRAGRLTPQSPGRGL